jgi:hypothetical protein
MPESSELRALHEQLERWAVAGLIDAPQASRIEAAEQARAEAMPRRRLPLVAEVLGYVGAVIAIAAVTVLVHQLWKHVPPAAELAVAGAFAIGLLTAGAMVRTEGDPAYRRLRSAIWLLATVSAAAFAAVVGHDYLHLSHISVGLLAEAAWLGCALPLWWRTKSALQHLALFGGAIAIVETVLQRVDPNAGAFAVGLALWILSVVWGTAVYRGYLAPAIMGAPLSATGALVGAIIAIDSPVGQALAIVTVAALLTVGIVVRRVLLIGVGTVGIVYVIPDTAHRYLPGSVSAPLAIALVGLVLLGIALWLTRHRRHQA